jgi:hypothetical protein
MFAPLSRPAFRACLGDKIDQFTLATGELPPTGGCGRRSGDVGPFGFWGSDLRVRRSRLIALIPRLWGALVGVVLVAAGSTACGSLPRGPSLPGLRMC